MRAEDRQILDFLDEEWRTLSDIRGRMNGQLSSIKLAAALQRLVTEGGIEKRLQGNPIPRTRGGMVLAIGLYRRLAVKEAAN
jgi:hypothetical protein